MLSAIERPSPKSRTSPSIQTQSRFGSLELEYDETRGILWKYISAEAEPYFSHDQLSDIRAVQSAICDGAHIRLKNYDAGSLKYVVFGSKIPGIFSLGGDLKLFRSLIAQRDRTGLQFYAKKATDAVFHHACNSRNVLTFSLVEGNAMGGGFEAALAGNIVVAERGTRLGFPEVLFGLFPGMGAYTFLRRRVNSQTAQKIILSARNYAAEDLFELGIIDLLADPGAGRREIQAMIAQQKNRPGASVFRKAVNKVDSVDHRELFALSEEWVDAAMQLPHSYLRRLDRLISSQHRKYSRLGAESNPGPTIRIL